MDLRLCYLFQDLADDHLERIVSMTKETSIEDGQRIITEGEEAIALYILKEGAVELMTTIEDDFEMPIAMLRNPGDCFGTASLISPCLYHLSARCASQGRVVVIGRSELKHLMVESHELGFCIMTNLAIHFLDRLKQTRQELKIHFRTLFRSMHP
jgi:CRP-like cAMP-binding protein